MAQNAVCLLRTAHQRMVVAGISRRVAQVGIRQLHSQKSSLVRPPASLLPTSHEILTGTRKGILNTISSSQKHNLLGAISHVPRRHLFGFSSKNDKDGKDLAETDPDKMTIRDKLKLMMRQYGKVTLGVYLLFDAISLCSFYTLVKAGVDVSGLMAMIGLGNSKWMTPGASTAVVAFAAHKLFSPIRILLTVAATPYAIKLLQRMGYIETPKTTIQEVKQEYQDVKQDLQVVIQSSRQQAQLAVRSYRMRVQSMREQRKRKMGPPPHSKQAAERRTPH
eukprot:comp6644_c0_seq1/m.2419 comp6644_c0_seq1/g.2419  ORF comp6644_c0_seq1/g.2419 comp6644_c0_seq1/m.2419 type:complete len:278 (-) comp6644_c0_seq1:368-1201(-)